MISLYAFLASECPVSFKRISGRADGDKFTVIGNPAFTFPLRLHTGRKIGDARIAAGEWHGKIFHRQPAYKAGKRPKYKRFDFGHYSESKK